MTPEQIKSEADRRCSSYAAAQAFADGGMYVLQAMADKQVGTLRQAAQQALETAVHDAISETISVCKTASGQHRAIETYVNGAGIAERILSPLRAALAQPDEPYAWAVDGLSTPFYGEHAEIDARAEARRVGGTATAFPLYRSAAMAQPGEAVFDRALLLRVARALEVAGDEWRNDDSSLRIDVAKALAVPQPAPVAQPDEPVAWMRAEWSGNGQRELMFTGPPGTKSVRDELTNPVWTPLYAAPQSAAQPAAARVPLTDAQMEQVRIDAGIAGSSMMLDILRLYGRAIERAHGIDAAFKLGVPQPSNGWVDEDTDRAVAARVRRMSDERSHALAAQYDIGVDIVRAIEAACQKGEQA